MSSYCLKCKENTENINPRVSKISNGKIMLLSKCALKKSRLIKKQEHHLRTPLNKIPLLK